MAFITVAGEQLIAEKQGNSEVLNITHFVLANISGLGSEPIDRIEAMPSAGNIKATLPVTKKGYINENQVVYSLVMDSTVGTFGFNWVGLKASDNTLVAVVYVPFTQKLATAGEVPGNNITRNFLIAYSGITATTAIDVDAETWQIDFTTRLVQIDERERLSNLDVYGASAFFGTGFKVTHTGGGNYSVAAGTGYVGGLRAFKAAATTFALSGLPKAVWLDVSLQGDINGKTEVIKFTNTASALTHYTDSLGFAHYVTKLADVATGNVVTDRRKVIVGVADLQSDDPYPQYLTKPDADALYEVLGAVADHAAASNPHPVYLTQAEGDARYKGLGYEAFASGTRLVFHNASAPTGWTKITTHNDAALRVVSGSGGGSGGSANFSGAFTHTHGDNFAVAAHTLTVNEIPAHTHGYVDRYMRQDEGNLAIGTQGRGSSGTDDDNDYFFKVDATTGSQGAGGGHNHGLTGAVTQATITPKYIDLILCEKN